MPIDLTAPVALLKSDGSLLQLALDPTIVTQLRSKAWVTDVTEIELPGYEPDLPGDQMNRLDFTLTQAQMQALHTTSVQIVAAPGVGSGIFPMFVAIYKAGATAYTIGAALVRFTYTTSPSILVVTAADIAANTLAVSGLRYYHAPLTFPGAGSLSTDVANKPLYIYSTAALTGSGGVVKGTIFYSIVGIT